MLLNQLYIDCSRYAAGRAPAQAPLKFVLGEYSRLHADPLHFSGIYTGYLSAKIITFSVNVINIQYFLSNFMQNSN